MKKSILFFGLITILFSCNTTEPPPPQEEKPTLTLTLEDASSIEAWIKLTTNNLQLPATVKLKQNDTITQDIILSYADTVIYIDSLLPNTTYNFQASSIQQQVSSRKLSVTTMDTTSHNFTWQTFTFGEHSSSVLNDVAIIDENNIWAVGEIYLNDSLGQPDPKRYNAAIWDGNNWTIKRVPYYYQGQPFYHPIQGIYAFASDDIWFCGNGVIHWDGNSFVPIPIPSNVWGPHQINKIWGTSSSDLYIVGSGGNIAWYNGSRWTRIESGTGTIINDVWGIISDQNKTILYCPVSSFFVPGDKKILKIIDGKVDSVSWNRDVRLYSAWAMNENFLFVCGEGAYENMFGIWTQIDLPEVGTNSIRGNNINDIFIVGDYGFITHFNGIRWKLLSTFSDKGYSEVSIKGNTVAVSGRQLGYGLIEIGIRN